jgi:hypothetical protein
MFTSKPKLIESTSFSSFVRNACASEKKRVFTEVLKRASEDQKTIIAQAKLKR